MRSSRLIIVTHEFAPFRGGVATYVEEVGRAIYRTGANVVIWAPDYGLKDVPESSCPVVRLPAGGSLKWRHLLQLTRALAKRRQEWEESTLVLASVGAHMAFMLLAATRRVRAKRIVSLLHGSEVLRFGDNPFWCWQAQRFFQNVDQLVTVSEFSKGLIEQSFLWEREPSAARSGIGDQDGGKLNSKAPADSRLLRAGTARAPMEKIVVAPCACSSAAARMVTAKQLDDARVRVLTLARVHPRKGQLETARALALLPAEMRGRVIYQIGGTGDAEYMQEVKKTCAVAGVAFEHLGEIKPESLAATYAQCDIYAMTSLRLAQSVEGFGITYLEAGFHGKPVVGYRSGGAAEAVLDGKTGLLVEEGNKTSLAEAFAKLISNPELREQLGAAGRQRAMERNWDAAAKVFLKLIN